MAMTLLHFDPPVIGHRGACAYAPENTLISFIKAIQLGVSWVEFDVKQAACGELIVFHDEVLDRTTEGKGEVALFPFSYLQSLDAGRWFNPVFAGERILRFSDLVEFLKDAQINMNVEIKAIKDNEESLVKKLSEMIQPYLKNSTVNFLFSSFSIKALSCLRQLLPAADLGLLMHEWTPNWQEAAEKLQCASIHVHDQILNYESAHMVKSMGKKLLCYTVNDPKRALELYSWGVEAVFSDAPDKIIRALK